MADASSSFSVINDVIITSLLLLKLNYTLYVSRLLDLSNNLLFKYFSLNVTAMFVKKTWLLLKYFNSEILFQKTKAREIEISVYNF